MKNQICQPSKILLMDESILFRAVFRNLFGAGSGFEIVAEARTIQEGIEKAHLYRPDIILIDCSLPDGTGLDAIRSILKELCEIQIILLTRDSAISRRRKISHCGPKNG